LLVNLLLKRLVIDHRLLVVGAALATGRLTLRIAAFAAGGHASAAVSLAL
jgi:hypothetical protein